MADGDKISQAFQILVQLGMPKAQQNDRTALCLLALLNVTPSRLWAKSENPLMGITPIMDFARDNYGRHYAPNSRETFRRFSMHQLVAAGIALYNPDDPDRPVNSPKAVYQIAPASLAAIKCFGSIEWTSALHKYIETSGTLAARYAKERDMRKLPVKLATGGPILLSPGEHSELIKAVIEEFAQRFAPGAILVYAGDTGDKWGYFDQKLLTDLGVIVDGHGKMPDVVLYYPEASGFSLSRPLLATVL